MIPKSAFMPLLCGCAAMLWFLLGIGWGLPSRDADAVMFGDRTPWTGEEILELSGGFEQSREVGADVDLSPTDHGELLNATDTQRAEIVRRYRLFTQQPDEWNTLRSLATMRPKQLDFDPRLYQYGGLWIYGVGGLIGVGHVLGLLTLTPDLAWYLDRPEEFAKLYIAARLWVVIWAAVGAGVMAWLVRRLSGKTWLGVVAAVGWCLMPVVVYASREAKPHLPSAVCMLIAIGLAMRYLEKPTWKRCALVGIACGAAFGFVLSGAVAIVLPITMVLLASLPWKPRLKHTAVGVGTMLLVYAITNPYAVVGFLGGDGAFNSNVGTTVGMYEQNVTGVSRWMSGIGNGLGLMLHAASPPIVGLGLAGYLAMLKRPPMRPVAILLIVSSLAVVGPYLLAAAGKPAEHARFALFADAAFLVPTLMLLVFACDGKTAVAALVAVGVSMLWMAVVGFGYQLQYLTGDADRTSQGKALRAEMKAGDIVVSAFPPAPWSMPAVDLWAHPIRRHEGSPYEPISAGPGEVSVRPVDQWPTPMSWGGKAMDVRVGVAPDTESDEQHN